MTTPGQQRTEEAAAKIDAYIAAAPEAQRDALQRLRRVIQDAAPGAIEVFAYGVPGFKYLGHPLLYYAVTRKHYAVYGHSQAVLDSLAGELAGLDLDKGTIRFPLDAPPADDLVRRIALVRIGEVDAALAAKKVPS